MHCPFVLVLMVDVKERFPERKPESKRRDRAKFCKRPTKKTEMTIAICTTFPQPEMCWNDAWYGKAHIHCNPEEMEIRREFLSKSLHLCWNEPFVTATRLFSLSLINAFLFRSNSIFNLSSSQTKVQQPQESKTERQSNTNNNDEQLTQTNPCPYSAVLRVRW